MIIRAVFILLLIVPMRLAYADDLPIIIRHDGVRVGNSRIINFTGGISATVVGGVATIDGSGAGGSSPGALHTDASDVTVTNTITETTLYSATIPANLLGSSFCAEQWISGVFTSDGTTSLRLRAKYATGTATHDFTPTALTGTPFSAMVKVCGDGSTSAQRLSYLFFYSAGSAPRQQSLDIAIDSTQAQTLAFTVEWGAATASVSITKDVAETTVAGGVTWLTDPGSNGIVKRTAQNTTAPAVAGTDYVVPSGSITGNAATATALVADGTNAGAGQAIAGVDAQGNHQGSFDVATQGELDALTNGLVADAGAVNDGDNPVHWKQIKGVPAGFADGTDDGGGGGSVGTLQQVVTNGRNVTDAVDAGTQVCFGGATNKTCFYDKTIRSYPDGDTITRALAGFDIIFQDAGGTPRLTIDGDTGIVTGTLVGTATGIAGVVLQGTGSDLRKSTGSFATNDCVKADANGNFVTAGAACGSGAGADTLQDVVTRGRSITDAVDVPTCLRIGGATVYGCIYANPTDGFVIEGVPAADMNIRSAATFKTRIRTHANADIATFDNDTKTSAFFGAVQLQPVTAGSGIGWVQLSGGVNALGLTSTNEVLMNAPSGTGGKFRFVTGGDTTSPTLVQLTKEGVLTVDPAAVIAGSGVDFGNADSVKPCTIAAGAAPTASGTCAYDTTAHRLKIGVNGSTKTLAHLDEISGGTQSVSTIAHSSTNVDISNSAATTTLFTQQIDANKLGTKNCIVTDFGGQMQHSGGGSFTFTVEYPSGSTADTCSFSTGGNLDGMKGQIRICADAATNVQDVFFEIKGAAAGQECFGYAATAVDSTANSTFVLKGAFSAASASNIFRWRQAMVKQEVGP